jgi:hypothetical protein
LKKKFWGFPWYAILFAVYPVLTLLAHNIGQVEYSVAYRALFVSLLASVFSVFGLYFILHDWKKAGILTVLWLLAFFFYGHVFGYVKGLEINGRIVGRHTYFMAVWLVLFLGIAWLTLKGSWQTALVPVLGTMSIVLIIFPLYQLVAYQYGISKRTQIIPPEISVPVQSTETSPDIYFIILDMYGRNDVLTEEFDYDDGLFLRQLKDMGFYVASCSQSNYHSTAFSLSATLDANYLNALSDQFTPENKDIALMWHLIQNSAVETVLRKQGYKVVAFETGYEWTEWEDADYFYTLQSAKINNFEDLLLRNSFPAVFSEKGFLDAYLLTGDQRKHDLALYVLDELENVPLLPGPKFVFVHLTIPHPPFVVGPHGEFEVIPPHYENNEDYYLKDEYKIGYRNQVAFLNMRIPQVFQAILQKSAQPPVIIVQGDHGPRFVKIDKQLDILNAYYFPKPQPKLYPSMTPVNNFRLIFNTYFGASLPYLPDRSYASELGKPYDFKEIPNDCTTDGN